MIVNYNNIWKTLHIQIQSGGLDSPKVSLLQYYVI